MDIDELNVSDVQLSLSFKLYFHLYYSTLIWMWYGAFINCF